LSHIVLLGDSIFDNQAYVPGQPDVVKQVRAKLPAGWKASLLAVDGAVTRSVHQQIARLPGDATVLAVSVGGNDALRYSHLFSQSARSVAEALGRLADARDEFGRAYGEMVDAVSRRGLPMALCTIYDARFDDPREQRLVVAGLSLFNDVITRHAFSRNAALLDLRLICNEPEDYANPIEPSAKGGDKIAAAIVQAATGNTIFPRSQVFAR
jgi:hypothetical protein